MQLNAGMACRLIYAAVAVLIVRVVSVDAQQSFAVEPTNTTATEGSALTMFCFISDKAGIATWIKGGNTSISVDSRIKDTANTRFSITGDLVTEFNLHIANTNLIDAGEYTCQVSASGASSEIVSQPATVTILNVQKFVRQPAYTSAAGGTTITMVCQVNNKEGSLSWRRDGFVISNETNILNSNPRFSIVGDRANGEYNVQIVGAQESDEGIYACFVTASGSSPFINSKEAFLSIISSGSQRLTIVHSDTIAATGTTTQLRCKVADKAGILTWLQNGQVISFDGFVSLGSERYSIVGNSTEGEFYLQITDVYENDQGTYYCIVNADGNNDAISSSGAHLVIVGTNDCQPNPCLNEGACTDGTNTHTCTNDCQPNPCLNEGACTDGTNTHTCTCRPGFTGTNCEARTCPRPVVPTGSIIHPEHDWYGTGAVVAITMDCHQGRISGDGILVCLSSGSWHGQIPKCNSNNDDIPVVPIIISCAIGGSLLIIIVIFCCCKRYKRKPVRLSTNSEEHNYSSRISVVLSEINSNGGDNHIPPENEAYEMPGRASVSDYQGLYIEVY